MTHVCFYVSCSDSVGVCGNVSCVAAVVKFKVLKYVVYLCKGCFLFVLWSVELQVLVHGKCACFVMQVFYVCVHPVSVLKAAFCMTFSLLMLLEDARDDHMEYAYSGTCLMIAL